MKGMHAARQGQDQMAQQGQVMQQGMVNPQLANQGANSAQVQAMQFLANQKMRGKVSNLSKDQREQIAKGLGKSYGDHQKQMPQGDILGGEFYPMVQQKMMGQEDTGGQQNMSNPAQEANVRMLPNAGRGFKQEIMGQASSNRKTPQQSNWMDPKVTAQLGLQRQQQAFPQQAQLSSGNGNGHMLNPNDNTKYPQQSTNAAELHEQFRLFNSEQQRQMNMGNVSNQTPKQALFKQEQQMRELYEQRGGGMPNDQVSNSLPMQVAAKQEPHTSSMSSSRSRSQNQQQIRVAANKNANDDLAWQKLQAMKSEYFDKLTSMNLLVYTNRVAIPAERKENFVDKTRWCIKILNMSRPLPPKYNSIEALDRVRNMIHFLMRWIKDQVRQKNEPQQGQPMPEHSVDGGHHGAQQYTAVQQVQQQAAHLGGGPKLVPDQAVVDKVNRPLDPAAVQVPVTQQRRQAVNQKKLVASAVENGMKMTGNEGPALDAEQVQRSRSRLTASPRKNPTPRQRMKHEANVPIQGARGGAGSQSTSNSKQTKPKPSPPAGQLKQTPSPAQQEKSQPGNFVPNSTQLNWNHVLAHVSERVQMAVEQVQKLDEFVDAEMKRVKSDRIQNTLQALRNPSKVEMSSSGLLGAGNPETAIMSPNNFISSRVVFECSVDGLRLAKKPKSKCFAAIILRTVFGEVPSRSSVGKQSDRVKFCFCTSARG